MKELLSDDEYQRFIDSAGECAYRGIRVNSLKCTSEKIKEFMPYVGDQTPFYKYGYYIPDDISGIGDEPFHHAGAFYVQEPSASAAVTVLDVQKGDYVLDLCAAPGGKSTQIAAELGGTGLLWSNEIVKNRANILLSNIERMGVSNAVVSNCHPDTLCGRLSGYFDKVLVDAPCSGEGMFRKDSEAIGEWSLEHSISCGERQLSILRSAANALKDGGTLVYSTCTFSVYENERVIERFLDSRKDFELADCGVNFGKRSMEKCVRILPEHGGDRALHPRPQPMRRPCLAAVERGRRGAHLRMERNRGGGGGEPPAEGREAGRALLAEGDVAGLVHAWTSGACPWTGPIFPDGAVLPDAGRR